MITFNRQVTPDYEKIECPVGSCWRFGNWFYAKVISENQVIDLFDCDKRPSIQIHSAMTNNDWRISNNDEFVAAYCRVINTISGLSGIEHLPLNCELDGIDMYDLTSNPES